MTDIIVPEERVYHGVAQCRWCGGRFRIVQEFQWLCENDACAERQISAAYNRPQGSPFPSPYLYLPLPLQVDIDEIEIRRLLVHGPAGISKSFGGRWSLYSRCKKIPGYSALLLRCTYDQLEKNHLKYMDAESRWLVNAKYERGTIKRMAFPEWDSEVRFGYCADLADIPQHTGPEWDEVLIEEAVQMHPQAIEEISSRDRGSATSRPYRMKHGIKGRSRYLTNPGGRAAIYLQDACITKNPDPLKYPHYKPEYYGAISGDIRDNPYLDPDFIEASLGGLSSGRYEQLAKGRWDVFPGQFFESFDADIHVQELEAY